MSRYMITWSEIGWPDTREDFISSTSLERAVAEHLKQLRNSHGLRKNQVRIHQVRIDLRPREYPYGWIVAFQRSTVNPGMIRAVLKDPSGKVVSAGPVVPEAQAEVSVKQMERQHAPGCPVTHRRSRRRFIFEPLTLPPDEQ